MPLRASWRFSGRGAAGGGGMMRARPGGIDGELTRWCAAAAGGLGLPDLAARVAVWWNPRMRTTAGRAFYAEGRIELNPKLREVSEEEILRTLKHELAHLVARERWGRSISPHGAEWRQACADLGIPGEKATHSLPFERRKVRRRFAYACPHCGKEILRVRRIGRRTACYDCCKKHANGRFHERFLLVERRLD